MPTTTEQRNRVPGAVPLFGTAFHLAAMLSADGRDVLLLGMDTSGDGCPGVASRRYDDIVVDGDGRDSEALRSAMTVTDGMVLLLCPA